MNKYRKTILKIERSDKRLHFIKYIMVAEGVEKFGVAGCVVEDVLKSWDDGKIFDLNEFMAILSSKKKFKMKN